MEKPKVIVICGPTASGKTALSIELAKKINGEIISADSMQIYKDMDIGTAKPTVEEMQNIKHYLIDCVSPSVRYSVADFKKDATFAIEEILKKDKDFSNIKEISSYINIMLKELVNEKDDIVVELNLKKLSDNFNIDYNTIKEKYDSIKKSSNNNKMIVKEEKTKKVYDKYGMAENYLIYYMFKDNMVINMVENKVGYFPTKNIRELSNEIIYYFHKYGIINVADFISYISDKEEILKTLKDIFAMNIKDDFQEREIEDYIFVVNEYHKEVKINDLNKKLKEEKDPLKQAKIIEEIMKLRGVNKNGTRN